MQRILIIGNNTLIGAGTEKLLQRECIFDVYGMAAESTASVLLVIQSMRPDTIILDPQASPVTADQLWLMLSPIRKLNVIEISTTTPYMRIFTQKQIWLTRPTNVKKAIDWLPIETRTSLFLC